MIKYTDKKSVIEAIQDDHNALEYTSRELRSDEDILIKAMFKHDYPLEYLTDILEIERSIAVEMRTEVSSLKMYKSATSRKN